MKKRENKKKSEVRSPKPEVRGWKTEVGSHPQRSRRMKAKSKNETTTDKGSYEGLQKVYDLNTVCWWWLN